jgi:outer membrane lipoprotein SlyB
VNRLIIGIGAFLGSTIGGYIPVIWGGSMFSLISIFFGVVGGIAGIIIGYRISKYLGFI